MGLDSWLVSILLLGLVVVPLATDEKQQTGALLVHRVVRNDLGDLHVGHVIGPVLIGRTLGEALLPGPGICLGRRSLATLTVLVLDVLFGVLGLVLGGRGVCWT
ncbi:hypothetical protein QBC39DRAFT_358178 [Podospora conica]|nr:hypothetical protein QBC39DRAFT_358178 [Schizothecium conicum]